jgi:hypothetical protein
MRHCQVIIDRGVLCKQRLIAAGTGCVARRAVVARVSAVWMAIQTDRWAGPMCHKVVVGLDGISGLRATLMVAAKLWSLVALSVGSVISRVLGSVVATAGEVRRVER